jgi:hypothetical protein
MNCSNLKNQMDKYQPVESSNLKAVGVKGDYLVIFFNNDTVYRYPSCSSLYEELISAPSVGRFFREHVKTQQAYQRINDDEWPGD